MQNKNYIHYTAVDFLKEESFLRWQLYRSAEDAAFWEDWLRQHPEQQEAIQEAIALFSSMKMNSYHFTTDEKQEMRQFILQKAKQRKRRISLYSVSAAACIAALVIFTLFSLDFLSKKESLQAKTEEIRDVQEIQLILPDNQVLSFGEDADITYNTKGEVSVSLANEQHSTVKVAQGRAQWNRLIVPKGKRSSLKLADGSKVWVNAGTTLEFPTVFEGKKRELFVDGEIYIDVTKNGKSPFYVGTEQFTVKVLGTKFNVLAYARDPFQSVVLEDGEVEVIPASVSHPKVRLKPDEMLRMEEGKYRVETVNVGEYTSWKDGFLQFSSESLPTVLSRLERYYGIDISYDPALRDMKCTGKLVLFDEIEEVLKVIMKSVPVKMEKRGNTIYITKGEMSRLSN